jgi:hypothetical protein
MDPTNWVYYVRYDGKEKYFVYRNELLLRYVENLLKDARGEHKPIELGVMSVDIATYANAER